MNRNAFLAHVGLSGQNERSDTLRQVDLPGRKLIEHVAVHEAAAVGPARQILQRKQMSASLIGHLGSSVFRPSATTVVSMSLTGSC